MTPIDEKMRESHLKWFYHVQRREINTSMRKSELIQVIKNNNNNNLKKKKKVEEDQNNINKRSKKKGICQLRK